MIECVFTLDYEIYGNGQGDLTSLVLEPTNRLLALFRSRGDRFVLFVEAAELEAIEAARSDPAIAAVKAQIRDAHEHGFEIALHVHPQWCNATYRDGRWRLDYREYNLCTLARSRMVEIVDQSIEYLRRTLDDPGYTPTSFRAGNWLFQPTAVLAQVLADKGIRVDSSVYKGGVQRALGLDYRKAGGNGHAWKFGQEVNVPDPDGILLEIPTYTELVVPWAMLTRKRLSFGWNRVGNGSEHENGHKGLRASPLRKALDLARLRYPRKLDFCRMTLHELLRTIDRARRADGADPAVFHPIVAIGHAKDLVDHDTVQRFLDALHERGIPVSTLEGVFPRCAAAPTSRAVQPATVRAL
jgi:hypothetical protein